MSTTTTFDGLGLSEQLTRALAKRNITEPFPIQGAAIPDGLAGRDIMGKAPTGSGKTLAFGLPLLSLVGRGNRGRPRALVLAPTRELAEQISSDLGPLAASVERSVFAIYGGVGYGPQRNALRRGVDVLVATPGRLEDLIQQRTVDLADVGIVVVDEADRMADMGFLPAVRRILGQTGRDRQTMLFSATLDGDVAVLSREYQDQPVTVEADASDELEIDAVHHFWRVSRNDRVGHTAKVIADAGRTIVFTRTRRGADRLAKQLSASDVSAVSMHGGRSQSQRTRALSAFSSGRAQALVATDVAARGIHVDQVAAVVHYDPAGDRKDYLHRSGRTARAGATGTVVTLVLSDQERDIRGLQRQLGLDGSFETPQSGWLDDGGSRIGKAPRTKAGPTPKRKAAPRNAAPRNARRSSGNGGGRAEGPSSRSIFVGNLPWETTADELETLFAGHGTVKRAKIVTQKGTGRSKGFGFVDMAEGDGSEAIGALAGSSLGGRTLKIEFAR